MEELKIAVRLDPQFALGHYNLGFGHYLQKNYAHALACAHHAIEANPNLANGHALHGLVLLQTGDIPGARAALRIAAKLDKQYESHLANLPAVAVAPLPREVRR
jgi:Flp pilus assembly protein TadD